MNRPSSRINRDYLSSQKVRRDTLRDIPRDAGDTLPELRDRLAVVEEILGLRTGSTDLSTRSLGNGRGQGRA